VGAAERRTEQQGDEKRDNTPEHWSDHRERQSISLPRLSSTSGPSCPTRPPSSFGLRRPSPTCPSCPSGCVSASEHEKLPELQKIESRVTHDRRHRRAASKIDHPPEGAEDSRGDRRVRALQQVACPEADARDHDAHRSAAEPPLEPAE